MARSISSSEMVADLPGWGLSIWVVNTFSGSDRVEIASAPGLFSPPHVMVTSDRLSPFYRRGIGMVHEMAHRILQAVSLKDGSNFRNGD